MRHHTRVPPIQIHPMRSLGLLSVAHAINHAQAVVLPLIFLKIIDEYGVGVETIAFLAAVGAFASGMVQLSYAGLTRVVSRRRLLGYGGILFGGGFALQAFATSFATFAIPNIASRIGGSPQHPVGNGLLAEQFPAERRGFAISAHIAGGNVGTVVVALIGVPLIAAVGWRGASIAFGLPAIAIAILILLFVRERGTDRAAALASGTVRSAFGRILHDRDLLLAVPHVSAGWRRPRPGRGQPLRADLHDPRAPPRRGHVRADVRGADRLLRADAARRRLAVGPDRAQAADHRRLSRWRDRVRRVPGGRLVADLAVGRDRPDGPVHVLGEPAAPGAPRRHRAAVDPRRVVRLLLRDGLRGRFALGRSCTASSSSRSARRRACRSSSG